MRSSVVLALALAGAAAFATPIDERHLVQPGEGIGPIRLGMTVPQVHEAMDAWGAKTMMPTDKGTPGAWMDQQAGAAIEPYQTDSLGGGRFGNVMKVFYVKNRVAQIAVQSLAYVTPKGASVRLASGEFRSLHPSLRVVPARDSWGGKVRAYDSERLGLAVTYTILRGDAESRSAQEMFVHNPGMQLLLESPRHATGAKAPTPDGGGPAPAATPEPPVTPDSSGTAGDAPAG